MANLERLKRLKQTVLSLNQNFNYNTIIGYRNAYVKEKPNRPLKKNVNKAYQELLSESDSSHNCGACGCFIGFSTAIMLTEGKKVKDEFNICLSAGEWLELTPSECDFLFYASDFEDTKFDLDETSQYLLEFDFSDFALDWHDVSHEAGLKEGLRRLDYIINHYELNT
jgi:hypothetical protein